MTTAWWLFYLFIYVSLCHLSQLHLKVGSQSFTRLQGSEIWGWQEEPGQPCALMGLHMSWLKVSLDDVGLETWVFLSVSGGYRSQFGVKDKTENRTRPSTVDAAIPYHNNGSKWAKKGMRIKKPGWGSHRQAGGTQRTKFVSGEEQTNAWSSGHGPGDIGGQRCSRLIRKLGQGRFAASGCLCWEWLGFTWESSHSEDVTALKEPGLLWKGRGEEDRVWSCWESGHLTLGTCHS